jgi:hypothetical protein
MISQCVENRMSDERPTTHQKYRDHEYMVPVDTTLHFMNDPDWMRQGEEEVLSSSSRRRVVP